MLYKSLENMHAEIGGGYAMGPKIIIDAAFIAPDENGRKIEIVAMRPDGDEIESASARNESDARRIFSEMVKRHAEPLQQAFIDADMKPGGRYTIFYLGEFGFPVVLQIEFTDMQFITYAQHRDVIKLTYRPRGKRNQRAQLFYNKSFIICGGWQDVEKTKYTNVLTDTPQLTTTMSKYCCFDSRYIEDAEKYLDNIILTHKDYKTGVDGKIYA